MKNLFSFIVIGLIILPRFAAAQLTNTGLPVRIEQNLVVTLSDLTSDGSFIHEGKLNLSGNLIVSGTFEGLGSIHFFGTDQTIDLPGSTSLSKISIEGGGLKYLLSPVSVTDTLHLGAGILVGNDSLSIGENGTISGGSDQSYVLGKLIRSGNGELFFPVGVTGHYAPVSLLEVSGTPTVGLRLVNENPNGQVGHGILNLSSQRFWELSGEGTPFSGAKVQLAIKDEDIASSLAEGAVAGSVDGLVYRGYGSSNFTGNLSSGTITSAGSLPPGRIAFARFFDETLKEADSIALVTIFESTGGSSWGNNTGWLSANLGSWYGITQEEKRVKAVSLSNNNLRNSFPDITGGLEALTNLNVSSNELVDIGNISSLSAIQTLDVSGNRLQFGVLEDLLSTFSSTIYAPQKEVLEQVRVVREIGTEYTIDRNVTGSNNAYEWFRNGAAIDETNSSFTVPIDNFSVDGTYKARVTNSNVADLVIETRPVILRVSSLERDSTSLRTIYDSLTTPQSSVSNWTALPLSQWPEATILNNRVTEIDLSNKGLEGTLPVDVLDLKELVSLNLSNNKISGLPKVGANLPKVTNFNLENNALEFDDLEKNMDVVGISYTGQSKIGDVVNDTIAKGEAYQFQIVTPGTANNYQWSLKNAVTDGDISGATGSTYSIDTIDYATIGHYTVKVTNDLVPGLTLTSRPKQVWATAKLVFKGIGNNDQPITEGFGYALKDMGPNKPFDSVAIGLTPVADEFIFDLVLGDYLIALVGDKEIFLPTYYKNTYLWEEADFLQLREDRSDTLYMTKVPGELTKNPDAGKVRGIVMSNLSEDEEEEESGGRVQARRKVKKAGCSMRRRTRGGGGRTGQDDEVWELTAYVETNDEGEFEFGDLPDGTYRFNIEYPGIPMDPNSFVEFEIGANGVEGNEFVLEAYVTENGIEVIKVNELGFFRKYFKDLNVYPNPADKVLTVSYSKLVSDNVQMQLLDLSGMVILEKHVENGYGNKLELDVSNLADGMYLLNFIDPTNKSSQIIGYKIFVRH